MKTIYMSDFGINSNSSVDSSPFFKKAITAALSVKEPCEIILDGGIYDVLLPELSRIDIHVSNTISQNDCNENGQAVSIKRQTPFLLEGASDITINGCSSLIKCHGKMTQIILKDCENITFENISFDYAIPSVTEMTVISCTENYIDCRISDIYPYKIYDGKLVWYGENFSFSSGISQLFDPKTGFTWRHYGPMDDKNVRFEELGNGMVRLRFNSVDDGENPYAAKQGYVFQMRDPIRDECGIILSGCKNTSFLNVNMHFMSGLGFIAQNCDTLTLNGFNAYPSIGRTACCAADFMHFSGCRGKITIENGYYTGAHDDAINVHSTHLKIMVVSHDTNELRVRFMHPQTYGIGGFSVGDEIGAIDPETLKELAKAKVVKVCEANPYEIILNVSSTDGFKPELMVENISANAEVLIRNNHFERIPTRGILVTTRKPVVIENNEFVKVNGCGVLIADDARSWFESGHVTDVTVRHNSYTACADSFVRVEPECVADSDEPVHSGIKIIGNLVETTNSEEVVYARNTDGLIFKNNFMFGDADKCDLFLDKVKNVEICDNTYNGKEWSKE